MMLGFANRLTEDAADEAGVIQVAKLPAPGAPIAKQLLARAPNAVPGSSRHRHFRCHLQGIYGHHRRWLCYSCLT